MHEGMQIATWVAWIVWNDYLARKYSCILINLVNDEERSTESTDGFRRLDGRSLDPNFAREEQDETDPIKVDTRSVRKGRSAGYN